MDASALIAEDEPLLAQALRSELARLWPQLRIVACVGDGDSALQQALLQRPSVCFLDIRMPGLSGLEVAQALAEDWPDAAGGFPLLVFITAYDQYAVQAFAAQAVDYLLKPVDPVRLAQCCDRLRARLAQPTPQALSEAIEQLRGLLATGTGGAPASGAMAAGGTAATAAARLEVIQAGVGNTVRLVPVDEVVYFEAADKYLRVLTAQGEYLIRMALRELLPQLDPHRFWQVHRGLVVQARLIASALRDESGKVQLTLRGRPEKLTVSRLYAHLFKPM